MAKPSAQLAASFSNIGHFLFHYFAAMYFTIVLGIERDWNDPYALLMELWFPASLLIGLVALPAGRLGDRWSSPGMLVIMFIGMGIATFLCSFVETRFSLMLFLAGLGFFGGIYHPVGIPWMIKTSEGKTGMRLAINGIFGGLGAAAAAIVTGWIIEIAGWRGAFMIPGIFCTAVGLAMALSWRFGWIAEGGGEGKREGDSPTSQKTRSAGSHGNLRAVALMLLPMFMLGLIYNTVQNALPKLFEERMVDVLGGQIGFVGSAVGLVYGIATIMQLVGGYLADRYSLKHVYLYLWILQAPLLYILARYGGLPLGLAAVGLTMAGMAILPAENLMLSRFAPKAHQGLVFGIKFVVSFGAAPLGLFLLTRTRESTGDFTGLLTAYAIATAFIVLVVLTLPDQRKERLSEQT